MSKLILHSHKPFPSILSKAILLPESALTSVYSQKIMGIVINLYKKEYIKQTREDQFFTFLLYFQITHVYC